MPFVSLAHTVDLKVTNQDKFIQELTPFSENLVYSAALSVNCQAAFMVLLIEKQLVLVGSYHVDIENFVATNDLPTWLMPNQTQRISNQAQLKELTLVTGHQHVKNAIGVPVILPKGIVGGMWFLNTGSPIHDEHRQHQLLEVFAHQVALILKRQLELFEMDQPHKIARERDFAFSVVNSIPSSVAVLDKNNQIIFVNSTLTQQFGYTLLDFQTHKSLFNIPKEDQPIVKQSFIERTTGKASSYRCRMFRKDQSMAFIEVNALPMVDSMGKMIGSVATLRDISDELALEQAALHARKAINKKLKDTLHDTKRSLDKEKNFAYEILAMLQDGFALLNSEYRFEYVNSAFADMVGFGSQALVGLEAKVFVHPDDLPRVRSQIVILEPNQVLGFQHRIKIPNGGVLHVAARISSRVNAQGQVIGTLLNVRDISKKILDEQRLMVSQRESQYQRDMAMTFVQTAQEGFFILKGEKIEFVNHQFEIILDAPASHFIGRSIYEFVHPDDVYLSQHATEIIAQGNGIQYQQRIIRPSGEQRIIICNASPRKSASGRIFGIVGSVRDITQELASQAKLTLLEQQIELTKQKLERGQGISGRLEDVGGVVGLLQMISVGPVNGSISLNEAKLYLRNGRVVAVEHAYPIEHGEQALNLLIGLRKGRFQFNPNEQPEKIMFNLDPTKLALEFLTRQDEMVSSKTSEHVVVLPSSAAAKAFMGGVGGVGHFRLSQESQQIVLIGRGLKIIVKQANLEDFVEFEKLDI
jgi:PAS domain S-box-containing protein